MTPGRKTHEAGQSVEYKPIRRETMIKWLNGLKTDSSVYRMWGNGVALPNASDCLGRIAKAVANEQGVNG